MDCLPRPFKTPLFSAVEIEVNSACDRTCSYCPNGHFPSRGSAQMDPDLFSDLIGQLREMDYRGRVSYHFYNEPLLHSDLRGVVSKTRRALPNCAIELYTNGSLLTRSKLEALFECGVSRFIVTPAEGAGPPPLATFLEELPVRVRQAVLFRDIKDVRLTNRGGLLPHLGSAGLALTACRIPEMVCVITVSGAVLPCFEDFQENLVMGSLKKNRLIDIWNSELYRQFRAELANGMRHRHPTCRGCNRFEVLCTP